MISFQLCRTSAKPIRKTDRRAASYEAIVIENGQTVRGRCAQKERVEERIAVDFASNLRVQTHIELDNSRRRVFNVRALLARGERSKG